jgi:hypothetical protein
MGKNRARRFKKESLLQAFFLLKDGGQIIEMSPLRGLSMVKNFVFIFR